MADEWQPSDAPPWAGTADIVPGGGEIPTRITVRPPGPQQTDWEPSDAPPWAGKVDEQQQPALTPTDYAKDIGLSTAIGVPKGLIGTAGLPEALAGYGAQALAYGSGLLGYEAGTDPESWRSPPEMRAPSAAQIRGAVENVTGPLYEPKTTPGKFGQAVGELLPAAAMGPGGLFRLAPRVIKQAVVPGIAGETAGQVTEQYLPEYAPFARAATTLAFGLPSLASSERKFTRANIDTYIKDAPADISAAYKSIDQTAASVSYPLSQRLFLPQQLKNDLNANYLNLINSPQAFTWVNDLAKVKDVKGLVDWRRMMREDLYSKGLPKSADVLTQGINNAIDKAMPGTAKLLTQADREFSLHKLASTLDQKFSRAEKAAHAAGSGQNLDNKIRQALIELQKDHRVMAGLTETERLKVQQIIDGGVPVNMLRYAANFLGGGGGLGHSFGTWFMTMLFGRVGATMGFIGGPGLKSLENRLVGTQAQNLTGSVGQRSAYGPEIGRMQIRPTLTQPTLPFYFGALGGGA